VDNLGRQAIQINFLEQEQFSTMNVPGNLLVAHALSRGAVGENQNLDALLLTPAFQ